MKYEIKRNTVQETLIIPLYARKKCTELYPNLFRDEAAVRLIEQVGYDFSALEKKSRSPMQRFGFLEVATGVFYYFVKEEVKALVQKMAANFPGCILVFDAANAKAVKLMLKTRLKNAEIKNIDAYFAVSNAESELSEWDSRLRVSSRGYMLGYNELKDPSVSILFRFLSKIGDGIMRMQIIKIEF